MENLEYRLHQPGGRFAKRFSRDAAPWSRSWRLPRLISGPSLYVATNLEFSIE
jgi:hypothetical protein